MIQVGKPLLYIVRADGSGAPTPGAPAASRAAAHLPAQQTQPQQEPGGPTLSNLLRDDAAADGWNDRWERLNIPTIASHYRLDSDEDGVDGDGGPDEGGSSSSDNARPPFQASPAVRRLGKEHGLDLSTIHPSGPHGRLLKSDVVTYLKEQGRWKGENGPTVQVPPTTHPLPPPSPDLDATVAPNVPEDRIVQLRGYHRLMMQSMTAALQIPHMCFGDELAVTELVRCRRELNDAQAGGGDDDDKGVAVRLSMLTMLIKACSLALAEHPAVNAVVHDAEACQLRLSSNHNIGIAVDTPRGLVVPVISAVQNKSLVEIQQGQ
jgi:2-oxoisovalerate dehydrogenase E2 component (dihydrolipoyl transacylase)